MPRCFRPQKAAGNAGDALERKKAERQAKQSAAAVPPSPEAALDRRRRRSFFRSPGPRCLIGDTMMVSSPEDS